MMDKRWQLEHATDWEAGVINAADDPVATTEIRSSPGSYLAYQFSAMWHGKVIRNVPEWKRHRCINIGAASGYIKSQFLDNGYSEEHIIAYFEEFFDTLMDPATGLDIKDGQTPWKLFCGWWGSVPVDDPRIERERHAEMLAAHDKARALIDAHVAERKAAWERINAAEARGERPERSDVMVALGGRA
jgi:hypothetical protein